MYYMHIEAGNIFIKQFQEIVSCLAWYCFAGKKLQTIGLK